MLVLSRKLGEAVLIGEHVRITIISIRGGRVQLGIEAPPQVQVRREEIVARPAPLRRVGA